MVHHRTPWRSAGVWVLALVALTACGDDSEAAEDPGCVEEALATATGYRYDAAFAIATSQAVAAAHPELEDIVDAATEYQRDHPGYEALELDDAGAVDAEVALTYVATLLALGDQPDIARPELLAMLAEEAGDEGLNGVHNLVVGGAEYPSSDYGFGIDALARLREDVQARKDAVADNGIAGLPEGPCPADGSG